MKSLIIGYGVTGKSFEKYLTANSINFDIFDEDGSKLENKKNILDCLNVESISDYKNLYISPGINLKKYFSSSTLGKLNYISDLDLFFQNNKSIKIGVTGTNGKSTLVNYLNQTLNTVSSSIALGNIGETLLDRIKHKNKYTVIEASSFQLEKMKKNLFDFSIITNIQKDHIDFHGNYENYKNAKLKICSEKGKTIFCESDDYQNIAIEFVSGIEPKLKVENLNLTNLPYRLQKISEGIVNDSKSTNSASLLYALSKLNFKGDLILCGNPKKEDYKELNIKGPRRVLIFGRHRNELLNIIKHQNISTFSNLDEIFEILQKDEHKDILFSPGNPSGDDYLNFIERGKHFNNLKEKYFD
tara:strand:+ start:24550 stop:25620 length:1071 start_codon:yes stop_codon:yes gene_type:complete